MINNESLLVIVENDGERCTQNVITLQRTSDSRSEEKPLE